MRGWHESVGNQFTASCEGQEPTWKASMDGLIMHIMVVLQLPPRESSRMRVSLESLSHQRCTPGSCISMLTAGT
jgi:hypothetical protein